MYNNKKIFEKKKKKKKQSKIIRAEMADKKEVNQAKLQALTSGAKKKSPFQKQLEHIESKKKARTLRIRPPPPRPDPNLALHAMPLCLAHP
jgi:hypothetical protein